MSQVRRMFLVAVALAGATCCGQARSESFTYKGGSFERVGTVWIEKKAGSDAVFAAFTPLHADGKLIVIFDATRQMLIRLPKRSGMSQWLQLDEDGWNDLAAVRYQP